MRTFVYLIVAVIMAFLLSLNVFRVFPLSEVSLFLTVIGLIYGLIAAFTINNSWERFSKIRDAIAEETSSLTNILVLLSQTGDASTFREYSVAVKRYCSEVVETEWNEYWAKTKVHEDFRKLFNILGKAAVRVKNSILFEQCFEELRQASTARSHQLVLAQTRISRMQWTLLLFLSLVLLISVVFLIIPIGFLSIFISTTMVISIFLILFVIYELDSMKFAENEVSNQPYMEIIAQVRGAKKNAI